jgi:hypothetical protein
MKIRPVRAELIHVDRRTDMTKVIVDSDNFSKAPKKWKEEIPRQDIKVKTELQYLK